MRKMKKLIGVVTAVATIQSSVFAGTAVLAEDMFAVPPVGYVTMEGAWADSVPVGKAPIILATGEAVLTGVEGLLVDPDAAPVVTPEAITTPTAAEVKADTEDGTEFTFSTDGITVTTGSAVATDAAVGYEIDGTELTISEPGIYYISGECTDGAVKVKKKTKDVTLVLNGLNLTSQTTAPLVMAGNTEVDLVVYGENVLADTEMNNDEIYEDNKDAENAVIKAKSDSVLTISGGGKLILDGNGKNALKSNYELVIEDVILDIDAVDNGISNENHMVINGGYVNVKAGGDGIKSASDAEPIGSITINGGTIIIDSTGDGIQATKDLTINDGIVDIMTYGGVEAEYDSDDDFYPSAKGLKASGSYEVENEETGEVEEIDATGSALTVNGGTIYLNCADDAMKSDGNVNIYGGYMNMATGCDGIQAEYINTIGKKGGNDDDLYIYISKSEEGIEGAEIYMNAGTTRVFTWDDGVNAANSDLTGYNFVLEVNGGNHYISCSEGDGFDSNGSLLITGGTTVILGSSGAGEGDPLDSETTFNITGGTVLAMGTYSPMGRTPQTSSYVQFGAAGGNMNQPGGDMGGQRPQMPGVSGEAIMPGENVPQLPSGGAVVPGMPGENMGGAMSNISIKDGNTVVVADESGNAIAAAVARWLPDASTYSAGYVFCWSENISKDEDYNLYVNSVLTASTDETLMNPQEPVNPQQPEAILAGDANGDGQVTLEDAQLVLKAALKIIELEDARYGDMNGDNQITLEDAQKVLRKALKID